MMMNKLQMMEHIKKVILYNCYAGMSISGSLLGEGKTPKILQAYTEEFLNHATETHNREKKISKSTTQRSNSMPLMMIITTKLSPNPLSD